MNLAIVGSRTFDDYSLMSRIVGKISQIIEVTAIVSGGANGADTLAQRYADEYNLKMIVFEAEWNKYGKKAGCLRNKKIVECADVVVAFWDNESKGTKHTMDITIELGKKLIVVKDGKLWRMPI